MKKVAAILAFSFFALSVQAQEAPAKEKTKKETSTTKKEATKTAKKQRNKAFWRGGVIGVAATLVAIILIK